MEPDVRQSGVRKGPVGSGGLTALESASRGALAAPRWDEYVEEDKLMPNTPENQQKAREFNGAPRPALVQR